MNKSLNVKIDAKILLIILLSLAAVMVTVYTFVTIKSIYNTKEMIKNENTLTKVYQSEILKLNGIREKENEITRISELAKIKIPKQPDEYKIIEFVNELARDSELLGISFASRINNPVAVEMPVQISARSDYPAMMEILEGIVGADRFYTIESLDITSAGPSAVNYIITFKAYFSG